MDTSALNRFNQRMEKMQSSPEYQANCLHFSKECTRLEAIGQKLCARIDELKACAQANTIRNEYASGSTLHRGFYCPSPTYDIIVGNTKRGKILKRLTKASKPSHEYGFDAENRMLYCKQLYNGQTAYTEYLVYREHCVYGITIGKNDDLHYLTEEILEDGKIIAFSCGLFLPLNGDFGCYDITQEHYGYDTQGLSVCDMHHFIQTPPAPPGMPESVFATIPKAIYRHIGKFTFRRKNGFLVSYTNLKGEEYQVFTQRKA